MSPLLPGLPVMSGAPSKLRLARIICAAELGVERVQSCEGAAGETGSAGARHERLGDETDDERGGPGSDGSAAPAAPTTLMLTRS